MARRKDDDLDNLIEEITTDAYDDEEQFSAFHVAFEDQVDLPADAVILGQTVSIIAVDYDGNSRRGITVTCRPSGDPNDYVISIVDIVFRDLAAARLHAAYRKWLGLSPAPAYKSSVGKRAEPSDLPAAGAILDLIVLRVKRGNTNCRVAVSRAEVILRSGDLWGLAPGEILTLKSRKIWHHGKNTYVSGEIQKRRIDASALGLMPLTLTDAGVWNPADDFEVDDGEPVDDMLRKILERGTRTQYEMESVLPGYDLEDALDDPDNDPIIRSTELRENGDIDGAKEILMDLLAADLRCLDAHAHLGNLEFHRHPERALPHYEIGLQIGDLSISGDFDGILSWGMVCNRPYLRCLYAYGLCLWREERFKEASEVFERLLWLDPQDHLDALSCLHACMKPAKTGRGRNQMETGNSVLRNYSSIE